MNKKNKKLLVKMNNEKRRSSLEKIKRKKRRETLFIVTLFLIVIVVFGLLFSNYLKLKTIEVEGNNQITKEEILEAGNINNNLRTWSIKDDEIQNNIKSRFEIFKSVTVKSTLPSSIKVYVEEYSFIAQIKKDDGNTEIIMENGKSYSGKIRNNYNLPILENFNNDGNKLEEVYKNLNKLKQEVRLQISEIIDDESDNLKRIEEKRGNCLYCIKELGRIYETTASKALLVDKDIESFRKNMYIYSKLKLMSRDTRAYLAWKKMNLFCILMSNNKDFLDFILRNFDIIGHEKEKYKKSEADFYLMRTILLAIRGNWEEVIARADFYSANPSKETDFKYFPLEFGFLKALAEKNIEKMKENINAMLEPKVARQMMYDENIFFYLHIYVLLYLKIASYYGFDLEIESDIVPKELIDSTPAKEYPEPYEFMKKFDLKTITPEEWKAWIYEYYPKPEELKEFEERGYFV